jgi:hypothetical protein
MKRSERAPQRRTVLRSLKAIRAALDGLRLRWDIPATVYVEPDQRQSLSEYRRPRLAAEYPENQEESWRQLAEWSRYLSGQFDDLALYADRMAKQDFSNPTE